MRRWMAACLAPLLLLAACTAGAGDGLETEVYYRVEDSGAQITRALEAVPVELDPEGDPVEQVLDYLASAPRADLRAVLTGGLALDRWTEEGGHVTVYLTAPREGPAGLDRTVTLSALVLSLTGLDDVERVSVWAGDEILAQELTADDIFLYDKETDQYSRQTRLYFAAAGAELLLSDICILPVSGQDPGLEALVMEELLSGAARDDLVKVIPEGTQVLSVSTEDGVCTLDLSDEFYRDPPPTAARERVILYSIVNSLAGLPGVDSVLFLREGETVDRYLYIPLDAPLTSNEQIVLDLGDREAVSVYLWSELEETFVQLPVAIPRSGQVSARFQLVQALIDGQGELGYDNPVPNSAQLLSVTDEQDGVVAVRFASGLERVEDEERTALAIALTLIGTDGVEGVMIQADGDPWPRDTGDRVIYGRNIAYLT